MPSYAFFGVQIVLASPPADPTRRNLRELVAESSRPQTAVEQRSFWLRFSVALAHAAPAFRRGHWDLIRGEQAEAEFETWRSEIEAGAAAEALASDAGAADPREAAEGGEYLLVTQIFLVGAGTNADLTIGGRCDLPDGFWQTRPTYELLVNTPPLLNFSNIRADAAYLQPGCGERGMTEAELADEAYDYLKPISRW